MKPEQSLILVVDDNENVRDLLTVRLEKRGYQVRTAVNGRQALDKMGTEPFDLVLLDIMMPEMNGYEVLEHLQTDPELRHVPVVVLSALNDVNSVVKCVDLGAEDYLFKPINRSLLWSRIQASLEKKHLRDQEHAHLAELAVMQQIDQELNATLDLRRAALITLDWAIRQTGARAGFIATVDGDEVVVQSVHELSLAPGDSVNLAAYGLETADGGVDEPVTEADTVVPAELSERLVAAIRREAVVDGAIFLAADEPFDDSCRRFVARLSDHTAIALNNARLYAAVQSANLAKSEFVAFVSHELRTPLTSINAYADLLVRGVAGETSERQEEFLEIIQASTGRMMALVSDLDDISRIEAGQLYLELSDVDLAEVITEVRLALEQKVGGKQQTMTVDLADALPRLAVDRMRLLQIMTNLISNASKYTPNGGAIVVRARCVTQDDRPMIEIAVEDNGLGISEEDQARIFSQFFRAGDEAVRAIVGTGLGLHITKRLVELHKGRIWFKSTYRQGTTFFLTLPALSVPAPATEPEPATAAD